MTSTPRRGPLAGRLDEYRTLQSTLRDAQSPGAVASRGVRGAHSLLDVPGTAIVMDSGAGFEVAATEGSLSPDVDATPGARVGEVVERASATELVPGARESSVAGLRLGEDVERLRLEPVGETALLAIGIRESLAYDAVAVVANEIGGSLERVRHLVERRRLERERAAAGSPAAGSERANAILANAVESVIEADSRAELERLVCERLCGVADVVFTWIGEFDGEADAITPSTWAGRENGYLRSVPPAEHDSVAARLQEMTTPSAGVSTIRDINEETVPANVAAAAAERGYRAVTFVPLHHRDLTLGVLAVYVEDSQVLDGEVEATLSSVGALVGRAVAGMDRERALLSAAAIEAEFRLESDELVTAWLSETCEASVEFESMLMNSDGSVQTFLTVRGAAPETVLDRGRHHDRIEAIDHVSGDETEAVYRLRVRAEIVEYLAESGIVLLSMEATDGVAHTRLELPPDIDVREFLESVQADYPSAELLSRSTQSRSLTTRSEVRSRLEDSLTDRQLEVLQVAYHSGYFDWPRSIDAGELADTLGVAKSTVLQHLRAAERKLLTEIVAEQRSLYASRE